MLCKPANQVGLMGFATDVRVLADPQPMGPGASREHFISQLKEIHSQGKFTDIEKVLRLALDQLVRSETPSEKAVVLLTDGKVDTGDVSKDLASVQAIRGQLLSDYIQSGVKIYCIAFSKQSDWTLLDYLSRQTGALAVRGNDPEELRQLFLRLFEEIAQPQSVPLQDSSALLDSSINEVTFVVSHPEADQTLRLVSPDAKTRIEQKTADRFQGVNWFASPSCDIITIKNPQAGKWHIEPPAGNPGDRVIILTDMELAVKGWEGTAHRGELTTATASLETKDGIVQKPEILNRLDIRGTLKGAMESSCRFADDGTHGDGKEQDGLFGGSLKMPEEAGRHDIEIIAKSPTFERRAIKNISIYDQLYTVEAENKNPHAGEPIVLKILASDKPAKGKMDFQATIQLPDGTRSKLEVIPVDESLFSVAFEDTQKGGDYRITVTGTLGEGTNAYQEVFGPLDVHVSAEAPVEVALPPMEKAAAEPPLPAKKTAEEPAPAPVKAAQTNGLFTPLNLAIAGGVFLILLVIAIELAILIRRRPRAAADPQLPISSLRKRAAAIRDENYEVPVSAQPSMQNEMDADLADRETDSQINETVEENDARDALPKKDSSGEDLIPPAASAERSAPKALVEVPMASPAKTSEKLSADEESLLAEIMGEVSDDTPKIPIIDNSAASTPKVQENAPQPPDPISSPETDAPQIALESELPGDMEETNDGIPIIPDGKDDKTDQEAIDDILNQIQNMIE
jgi:uncharacterized protein (TIGR03503 family)